MDDTIYIYLAIFSIFMSIFLLIISIYYIKKEMKLIRTNKVIDQKISSWFTNSILLKYVEYLTIGINLAVVTTGLVLLRKHIAFAFAVISAGSFVQACSTFVSTIVENKLRRWRDREIGEEYSLWLSRFQFHQGLAASIFLLGISLAILLNGLIFSVKVIPLEISNQIDWSWEILILIGGLYWLTMRAIQIIRMRKHRASSPL